LETVYNQCVINFIKEAHICSKLQLLFLAFVHVPLSRHNCTLRICSLAHASDTVSMSFVLCCYW